MLNNIQVYLALGSNLGDRQANLVEATKQLQQSVTIKTLSAIYETKPAYITDQPNFYNMVLQGLTTLSPQALLRRLKSIENDLGRRQTVRYGPRPIDVDILLYGEMQLATPDLVIPHPRMTERAFVLIPLAEIAPDLIIPGRWESAKQLAARLTDAAQGQVVQIIEDVF